MIQSPKKSVEKNHDLTRASLLKIYYQPLLELVFQAAKVHREYHDPRAIQISSLLSIKTGGCSEDCKYCSQSLYYKTEVKDESLLPIDNILLQAQKAKNNGSDRFCLGTAWRNIPDIEMEKIQEIIKAVAEMGLEVCATMGMVTLEQAQKLKKAGLSAYNHNLDTGPEFYSEIISTRTYEDRLETISNIQKADIKLCSGAIIGMGERIEDRMDMLLSLLSLETPPESVPINVLVPIEGTEIMRDPSFDFWNLLRMVATTRIVLPTSRVRLSAGRNELNDSEQAFCFFAGANSIFSGSKLLTTPNTEIDQDAKLLEILDLYPLQKS